MSTRRKLGILAICCLSVLMTIMDLTIVNLAIPSIRTDLGATAAHAQWTIAIYALGVASLQLLGGEAGDRFGRRRVLQIGTTVFMLGSLLCSLAPAAVSSVPQDRAGAAAGITSTSKQVGISLGVAFSGVLAAGALSPPGGDFTPSADPLWLFTPALGLAIAALAIISTSPRAQQSAERLAPLIIGETER